MAKFNPSNYQVGAIVRAASARANPEKTTAPQYFTEASLLEAMCEAWRFAGTEQDRAMLKETNGIGTARTRGDAIKDLINGKLIERHGKGKKTVLKDSAMGRALNRMAPAAMKSVVMTAKWEMLFAKVSAGEAAPEAVNQVINKFVGGIVMHAKQQKDGLKA